MQTHTADHKTEKYKTFLDVSMDDSPKQPNTEQVNATFFLNSNEMHSLILLRLFSKDVFPDTSFCVKTL